MPWSADARRRGCEASTSAGLGRPARWTSSASFPTGGRRSDVPASAATPHPSTVTWRTSTASCARRRCGRRSTSSATCRPTSVSAPPTPWRTPECSASVPCASAWSCWKGGRNIDRARRLASFCEPRAESFGESWTRLRILDAGFPRPVAQVPLGSTGTRSSGSTSAIPTGARHRVRRRRVPHRPRRPASRRGTAGPDPRRLRVDGRRRRARRHPRPLTGLRTCDRRAAGAGARDPATDVVTVHSVHDHRRSVLVTAVHSVA